MARNKLNLSKTPLLKLRVGRAALYGPYESPTAASAEIDRARRRAVDNPRFSESPEFTQKQLILVDVDDIEVHKMYLITRTR